MSFFKDFFYKVRVLLDGDTSEEDSRESKNTRGIDEAMNEEYHAPERREFDYEEDDYDDYEESPSSLAQRMADAYIDDEDEEEYFDEQPEPSYQRGYRDYDEDEQYFVPQPEQRAEPQPQPPEEKPLPTRTEVTLREIARLSQQLDDATLDEYKRRIVMIKQQTGAVSALTALRVLHEYVEDDIAYDVNGDGLPDLSAK